MPLLLVRPPEMVRIHRHLTPAIDAAMRVGVKALVDPIHRNQAYDLTGPEALTYDEGAFRIAFVSLLAWCPNTPLLGCQLCHCPG